MKNLIHFCRPSLAQPPWLIRLLSSLMKTLSFVDVRYALTIILSAYVFTQVTKPKYSSTLADPNPNDPTSNPLSTNTSNGCFVYNCLSPSPVLSATASFSMYTLKWTVTSNNNPQWPQQPYLPGAAGSSVSPISYPSVCQSPLIWSVGVKASS